MPAVASRSMRAYCSTSRACPCALDTRRLERGDLCRQHLECLIDPRRHDVPQRDKNTDTGKPGRTPLYTNTRSTASDRHEISSSPAALHARHMPAQRHHARVDRGDLTGHQTAIAGICAGQGTYGTSSERPFATELPQAARGEPRGAPTNACRTWRSEAASSAARAARLRSATNASICSGVASAVRNPPIRRVGCGSSVIAPGYEAVVFDGGLHILEVVLPEVNVPDRFAVVERQ